MVCVCVSVCVCVCVCVCVRARHTDPGSIRVHQRVLQQQYRNATKRIKCMLWIQYMQQCAMMTVYAAVCYDDSVCSSV